MPGGMKPPSIFCGALAKPKQNFYSFVYAPTTAARRAFKSASVRFRYVLRQLGQRHYTSYMYAYMYLYIYVYIYVYIQIYIASPFTIRWTSKCLQLILELIFSLRLKIFSILVCDGVAKNINVALRIHSPLEFDSDPKVSTHMGGIFLGPTHSILGQAGENLLCWLFQRLNFVFVLLIENIMKRSGASLGNSRRYFLSFFFFERKPLINWASSQCPIASLTAWEMPDQMLMYAQIPIMWLETFVSFEKKVDWGRFPFSSSICKFKQSKLLLPKAQLYLVQNVVTMNQTNLYVYYNIRRVFPQLSGKRL